MSPQAGDRGGIIGRPTAAEGARGSGTADVSSTGVTAAEQLFRPLVLGSLTLDRRLFMAPMAGLTTPALRRSVRRWGAGLVHTEMISACGIHYGNRRTLDYLSCAADEHPIGFQLFGADPAVMARAALVCLEAGADLIDVNMACPVRKVTKTGAGAALLDDAPRAAAIVTAIVGATAGAVPVTVKLRSGVRAGEETVLDLGPRLVEAGAAALCLHPRTAGQLYRGRADHEVTRRLAAAVPVPVVASGDVADHADCSSLLAAGAAAVMVARAALGRPWVFAEILLGETPPGHAERLAELRTFAGEVIAERGARAVGHLRQFWPSFRRGGTLTREQATRLMTATAASALRELLDGFAAD
jgi:tRNA-dihydrouridine synthase B